MIWSYTGEVRALNLLARPAVFGMIMSEAQAINDAGEIVALSGGGEHADDKEHANHFYHVFMLNADTRIRSARCSSSALVA